MDKYLNKLFALKIFLKEAFKRFFLKIDSKKVQNIGYIGGHGVNNLGDDIMYSALKKYLPKYNIFTFQTVGVEKALSKINLSGTKFFNRLILGGGTLINDIWFDKVQRSLDLEIPILSLGTGVGSCGVEQEAKVEFKKWNAVLSEFQYVGVRGRLSQRRLFELGIESEITGDLALLLADKHINLESEKKIVLNLMDINDQNIYWEKYIPAFRLMIKNGWIFQPLVVNPIDLDYTRSYFKKLGISDPIYTTLNFDNFRNQIKGARLSINVRLHAGVLSLCTSTPCILFGYRDKCYDFMQSLNLADYYIPVKQELESDKFTFEDKLKNLISDESNNELRKKILNETTTHKNRLINIINNKF